MIGSDYFNNSTLTRDLFWILTEGETPIGKGIAREVYRCTIRPEIVLKFEFPASSFQNAMEWAIWKEISEAPEYRKWFAPCRHIGAAGSVLAMDYAEPFRGLDDPRLPKQVPAHFADLKIQNWGLIKGRPVCIDYGMNLILTTGLTKRLKKAEWWSN